MNSSAKYTLELRQIVDTLGINIFPFIYNRLPESQAIISNEQLQADFIRHFKFREIGQETIERFISFLEREWCENIGQFDLILIEYSKPFNVTSNGSSELVNIDNDTPKNSLDFGEQSNHASFITHTKSDVRVGATELDLRNDFANRLKDVEVEFFDKLDALFMQIF